MTWREDKVVLMEQVSQQRGKVGLCSPAWFGFEHIRDRLEHLPHKGRKAKKELRRIRNRLADLKFQVAAGMLSTATQDTPIWMAPAGIHLRRVFPSQIASQLISVQPMTAPAGMIFGQRILMGMRNKP